MSSLNNQIAIVTGASSGIGRAIALSLAQAGAQVYIVGRHLERLQAVANAAPFSALPIIVFQADLSQEADILNLVENIQASTSGIDLLVHSAGIILLGRMDEASLIDLDRHYQLNVRAPYLLTQVFLPSLTQRKGQIVFINSSAGLMARGGVGQYAASKHALKAIADSLREEVNPQGIRVLSVYPGRTASLMQQSIFASEQKIYRPDQLLQAEDIASVVLNALALPRTAELTDIHIRPLQKTQS